MPSNITSMPIGAVNIESRQDRTGSGDIRLIGFELRKPDGISVDSAITGQDIELHFHYTIKNPIRSNRITMSFVAKTMLDVPIFQHHNRLTGDEFTELPETGTFICKLKHLPLLPSTYRLDCAIMLDTTYIDLIRDAVDLQVTGSDFFGTGRMPETVMGYTVID